MFNPLFPLDNISEKLLSKCPVCENKKDFLEMTVVEGQEDNSLVHIKCKKCYSGFVGVVNLSPLGVNIISFSTDLEGKEVAKFKQGKRVTEDDVLGLHLALEDKKVDFLKIISKM